MKRIMSLTLAVLLVLSLAACGGDSSEGNAGAGQSGGTQELTDAEAQGRAKQAVVNEMCRKTGVKQIYLHTFNIWDKSYFDATEHELDPMYSRWKYNVKGTFSPVDSYGKVRGTYTYDATIEVSVNGWENVENFRYW